MATVGNGYLSSVIGSDSIYVAGVFSGVNVAGPSHRARIPATNSITISNGNFTCAALDLKEATYYRRLSLPGYSTQIEQRWYASRADKSLFIHEIYVDNSQEQRNVKLSLNVNEGKSSADISFTTQPYWQNDTSIIRQMGKTVEAEYPTSELVTVAVVSSVIPNVLPVVAGQQRTFTFITAIKTGLESTDPLSDATIEHYNARQSLADLKSRHIQEWARLWESRIEFAGNLALGQVVNSTLYYLLSSARQDVPWSLSPGGLASNSYNGHTFWDTETWMYPGMLVLFPEIARDNLLQYRINHQDGAMIKALSYNLDYEGTMFPWESAFTGQETCPSDAPTGEYEQHISGDIAFAIRQYWELTQDTNWLLNTAYPVVRGIAKFWASKAQLENGLYVINGVIPPDEYAFGNNSVYTNVVAKMSLDFAVKVANMVGDEVPEKWIDISSKIKIPFDDANQIHLEFDGYNGQKIKQADVILLGFPLNFPMSKQVRLNDLDYYSQRTDENGPAMTYSMEVISRLELGQYDKAVDVFPRAYANYQAPFGVWTETPQGGAVNFITGAGGFLQSILFGWGGIRILENELYINPTLPPNTTAMTMRGVHFRDATLQIQFTSTSVTVTALDIKSPLTVKVLSSTYPLNTSGSWIELTLQSFSIL
eukprot:TRINITY_DN14219_c0_g1_i1.p1 TRINITY_DN14219_c0_g1~~TRINITY_DN14219_c0_g1_i1.p1  ORF type:complete len:713 (-),score=152.44 TRINITY_DN14219_c0_g1_i1:37-1992(-)